MRLSTTCAALLASLAVAQDADHLVLEGVDDGSNYYQQLHPCPLACDGSPSSAWIMYSSWDRFAMCSEPVLLSFALANPVLDPDTPTKITTCTAGDADSKVNALFISGTNDTTSSGASGTSTSSRAARAKRQPSTACEAASARASAVESKVSLQLVVSLSGADPDPDPELSDKRADAASTALRTLQEHFDSGDSPCEENVMFAHYQGVVAGVYIGASFDRATVASVAGPLLEQIRSRSSTATTVAAQLCGAPDRNARHTFGLVVDVTGNIAAAQEAVRGWNEAKCLAPSPSEPTAELKDVLVLEDKAGLGPFEDIIIPQPDGNNSSTGTGTGTGTVRFRGLTRRAECRIIRVEDGDGCASLAARCGISGLDFMKFNAKPSNLCSILVKGMPVCCSAGDLPDIKPKPDADGTCAKHLVVDGDSCSAVAAQYGITIQEIEDWNKGDTWGWYGCGKLLKNTYICVSDGKPPMPYPQRGAVCGPTKEGTTAPTGNQQLKDLNPCPLNACCNVWGNCGISGQFCMEERSSTGNPGTSALRDGCVSSCGMDIRGTTGPVASFGRIAYYETWNFNRTCLWQHVENANTDGSYTMVHWAFAEINTADWTVKIKDDYNQWAKFKTEMGSAKRVISFGGWGYSTEPGTYDILRQAMSPANRNTFAANVAKFLADEGLDGADFDWEYPSNPDIEGAVGKPEDVVHYLRFLTVLRSRLKDTGRTLSIAAPASFWYLKPFPIRQMAELLDYIVFMTYDLHGQWDAGGEHAIEGCPAGNCVRSHVNLTEVTYTLSMITKAGVPPGKIYVGESSYGRSFRLAQAGCTGPMCTFLGDRKTSPARPGRCTGTGGYLANAEIDEIVLLGGDDARAWHDGASNSDMLLYGGGVEWVAYMSPTTKATRRDHWRSMGFAGTIDWAVDLQAFTADELRGPDGVDHAEGQELPGPLSRCADPSYESIEAVQNKADIPHHCRAVYLADVLANTITRVMGQYDALIRDGYDAKFNTYADAVVQGGNKALYQFMYDNGNKYFECQVWEKSLCCGKCNYYLTEEDCRYCQDSLCNGWKPSCETAGVGCKTYEGWVSHGPECPPDYSKWAGEYSDPKLYGKSVEWTLREDKKDDFWADLYAAIGIEEKDVAFRDVQNRACGPNEEEACAKQAFDYNFPVTSGFERDDVLNPKDVVQDAYNNLQGFVRDLPAAVAQMRDNAYDGRPMDLVEAIAMPIFMIEEAVSAIQQIADTVDEWDRKKRENIILLFLSAIFFFVPVLGQLAGTIASLANVARVLVTIGVAGSAALDIYSVVNSEGNDPLDIFALVLAPLAVFDGVQMARAAARARNMKDLDIKKFGDNISGKVTTIRRHTAPVCPLPRRRGVDVFAAGALPMSSALDLDRYGSLRV